ncbi:CK1 family protein kinase [Trichomonas vaginalis G3]|uniref:non-specific serine/threonine protein kinase n=1 Tax=Trichomonas vaginalis (strain ATCC PRA-98 / G3) TaxID=412133 RepID=A2F4X8_TRIV3|nr:protein kinase protein [Trichomonas vaginalis G3]EAY00043.1 CK1 family protein kinase [Trichomonas vaginalis G3]KAI5483105.1 protein kinase protein [Trichomonas vaginalis G3]|eukprot:XP_001312972.1 CK1 family protein kinase [Trichomonas vaginalis G3]
MLLDGIFEGYKIQKQFGHGSFGQVYIVKSEKDGKLYAGKAEVRNNKHSSLLFEIKLYPTLQQSQYIPRFIEGGSTNFSNYLIIEFIGPSILSMLSTLKRNSFSLSSGLRISYHMLKAVKEIHDLKVIHRDLKPSNVLITKDRAIPIKIIDFGLSRIYINHKTGAMIPERDSPGFRGTALYCSVNAHLHKDLSRCDDLFSWYFVSADLINGGLPWKGIENRDEIIKYKRDHDMGQLFRSTIPEYAEIWNQIKNLKYDDQPDYQTMFTLIEMAMTRFQINLDDPYDWEESSSEEELDYDESD